MDLTAELCTLIERHAGEGGSRNMLGDITLSLRSATIAPEPITSFSVPTFTAVIQGSKRTVLGDRLFRYCAGQYLIVSADLPLTAVIEATPENPFRALAIVLRPSVIADLLFESGMANPARAESAGIVLNDMTPGLLDSLVRLVRLLDEPADVPILAKSIEREILWRLITGTQGGLVRQIGLSDSRLSQVGQGIRWIRDHYAEMFRIEDLAQMCGMSIAAFHRHFRAVTAMSPIQYQKHIRLQEARARLIAETQDVAAIGFSVGYESPSQFSREYRRRFGVPPSKDAMRLQRRSSLAGA